MRLRGAWPHEAEILAAVHGRAFAKGWSAADIAELTGGPGGFALMVEEGDNALGFILCRAMAGEAEVLTLAVDPPARRRGLARALVDAALGAARMAGAGAMFLEVAHDNAPAIALYQAAGFTAAGTRRGYYRRDGAPSADALVMRRELGPG
jgi:ribosomal-protein-alanine N-acetyltransferase